MADCIFCDIVKKADPQVIIYQDDRVTVFNDHTPRAPVHMLVVPNRHFNSISDATAEDEGLIGHMLKVGSDLAASQGLSEKGFRLVINTGPDAGQSVFHLHLHVLGGKPMPMNFGWNLV